MNFEIKIATEDGREQNATLSEMTTPDTALEQQQQREHPNLSINHHGHIVIINETSISSNDLHNQSTCSRCNLSFPSVDVLNEHITNDHMHHETSNHTPQTSNYSRASHPPIFTESMDNADPKLNASIASKNLMDCQSSDRPNFHEIDIAATYDHATFHPHNSSLEFDSAITSPSSCLSGTQPREFKYRCRACQPNRIYFDRLKLERHVERRHKFEIECDFCVNVFQDEKSLKDHLEHKHNIKLSDEDLKDDSSNRDEDDSDAEGSDYILPDQMSESKTRTQNTEDDEDDDNVSHQMNSQEVKGNSQTVKNAPTSSRSVRKASRKCLSRIRKMNGNSGADSQAENEDIFSDLELDTSQSDSETQSAKGRKKGKRDTTNETPEEKARRQKKKLPEGASRRYKGRPSSSVANNVKKKTDARCKYQEFKSSVVWSGSRSRNTSRGSKDNKEAECNEAEVAKKRRGRPKKCKEGNEDNQEHQVDADGNPEAPEWEKHLQKLKKKIPGVPDTCRKCGKEFSDDNVLVRHLKFDHYFKEVLNLTDENPMKREQQWRNQVNELLARSSTSSNVGSGKWGSRDLTCDICKVRFGYPCTLAAHRKEKHDAETIINGQVIDPGPLPTETESFVCDECGFTTKNRASFESHYIAIHKKDKNPYPCDQCDELFLRACGLLWHRRQQHMKTPIFVCDMCGRGYRLKYLFLRHQRLDHGGHRYQCKLCPKSFKGRASYDYHRRKHMGVEGMKFICEFCGMRFWANQNKRKHIDKCHADGVYDHAAIAMNQSKDWSAEASGASRCVSSSSNRAKSTVANRLNVATTGQATIATLIANPIESISQYSDQSVDDTGYQVQHIDASALTQQQQEQMHAAQATIIAHPQHQQLQQISGTHLFQTTDQSATVTHSIYQEPSTSVPHGSCQFTAMQPVSVSMFTYPNIPPQVLHQPQPQPQPQPNHLPMPGKCRLCFADVDDLRYHMISFHKVAGEALKLFLQ